MPELHLAYADTPHLTDLLGQWDAQVAAEGPVVRHRWTNIGLWPAARSATVAGSTGIEGNSLTATQVGEVLAGGVVGAPAADIREVLNYNSALDLANRAALRPDFEWSQELLRRLNATVVRGLEDDERGEYRREPVSVGQVYTPPEYQLLPTLMRQLVEWLRDGDGHPLVRAGLTHLNVVSIHPWLNGNGRTARIAGSLMLMRCGIGAPELLNVESEIRANTGRYAAVLQATHGATYNPEERSATAWLEYFAEICVFRLDLRNRLAQAFQNDFGLLFMELDRTASSPEWPAILMSARLGPIRTSSMAGMLGLSSARVRAMLAAMAAAGWLEAVGERRGRRYGPGTRLLELPLRAPELMERFRGEGPDAAAQRPGAQTGDH
jgi:Fic family protein